MICLTLFATFFKIGAFTFGGGYAMLPLIQQEVLAHGWLDAQSLVDFIAVSESTPGPFAVNIATYVGSEVGGLAGALCATLGVVLPSFLIILLVARCYEKFKESRLVKGCLAGLRPAVVGMIGAALLSVAGTVFAAAGAPDTMFWAKGAILAVSAVLAFKKVHPIWIICFSAGCGILLGYLL